ncbi:homoserine kinase [Cytophagaceae bacterium DM2B3-1]|uniref:Homoserine kinase n=1 Tax=Xanthocytophaga flava TaxID=3048013 RepID=A0ABT7CS05_9BACT|nr:homoserine kinase [Xanthocytophaga flavus]MDJ1471718.1 homoserine kinase [Xanthocytophaga flavus]MDJ1496533.1 homoserine kinase [Xanthocytophaga flavus]
MDSLHIFAPATVANVAAGFDILGFALNAPGDEITIRKTDTPGITIHNKTEFASMPLAPEKNTAGVALQAYLQHLGSEQGFEITFLKKIKPGSGIGSSAASSAAAVFGANELLGRPLERKDLVQFAMQGEKLASGSAHADNVAPALMGGFVLVRSYNPLDLVTIPVPENLYASVIHPQIELKTEDSRRVLRKQILLKDAVVQWGNTAGLIAGLFKGDYELIGRSLQDVIIEPIRSLLIPGFESIKTAALQAGALGCSISGSGPSIFTLSTSEATAQTVAKAMQQMCSQQGIESEIHVSPINTQGPRIVQ